MTSRLTLVLSTLLASVLLLAGTSAAASGWAEFRSPFFTVYSDESPKEARELLEKFELFRRFVILFTGVGSDTENDRLQIFMFRRKSDFAPLAGNPSIRGFYLSTDAGPRMVVGPGTSYLDATTVLFHEYVHYFLGEYSDARYPRWYNEGLAEVFGATEIKKNTVVIGAVPEGRDLALLHAGPLGVEALIDPRENVDSSIYASRFYATAWLFTHYLQIGTFDTDSELKAQAADYLGRFASGEDSLAAFKASFSTEPNAMNARLRQYRRSGNVPVISFPRPDLKTDIAERPLGNAETAFVLADLAWRLNEEQIALDYLAEVDPASHAAPALSLRAVLEHHKNDSDVVSDLEQAVLDGGEGDSITFGNLAHLAWDRYESARNANGDTDGFLENVIRYGSKAVTLDPSNMEAHRFLWKAHAASGDTVRAAKSMVAAYQLYPSSVGLNYEMGRYLMQIGKPALAHNFLEVVRDRTHSDELRREAAGLLEEVDAAIAAENSREAGSDAVGRQ